ncbi:MAG TPA: DUF4332 domain-containing protein [Caldilineae bacterium]|nr:DUF4332 domain-containing protein [Caldilineae bacterium]
MRWLKLWIGLVVGLLSGWIVARFLLKRRQAASEEAVYELRPVQRERPKTHPAQAVSDTIGAASAETETVEREPIGWSETKDSGDGDKPSADDRAEAIDLDEINVDEPIEPDDFRKIEGIGPKISDILHENGILTFAQLARTDPHELRSILTDAGPRFRLANPATWPQQAQLAATGDWDGLLALQSRLKHGR